MAKAWEEMNQSEKTEDLRKDILRIFKMFENVERCMTTLALYLDETRDKVKSIDSAVVTLQAGAAPG